MLKITSAAASNIGKIKSVNGDNFYLNESFLTEVNAANGAIYLDDAMRRVQYYAVFDGFDEDVRSELTYNARFTDGNAASRIAAEELLNLQRFLKKMKEYDLDRLVHIYATKTNRMMNGYTKEKKVRIGASFALLCIDSGMIKAYNIGNAKIFMLRDNRLITLTTDDTKVEAYAASGVISGLAGGGEGVTLTQHLGHTDESFTLHTAKMDRMKSGDKFLICTESICRYISKQKLHNFITLDISEQEILNEIMAEASRQGGEDNYTAVIVEVRSAEKSVPVVAGNGVKGFIPIIFKKPVRFKPAQIQAIAVMALFGLAFVLLLVFLFNGPLKSLFGDPEDETEASENISVSDSIDDTPSEDEGIMYFTDPTDTTEPTGDTSDEPSENNNTADTSANNGATSSNNPNTASPPTTTAAPQTTTRTPQTTTAAPQTTTRTPQTTTAAPQTTTRTPQTTTAAPQTTTGAPQTTTAAPPVTTTAPPETTTAPPAVTIPPPTEPTINEEATVGEWID